MDIRYKVIILDDENLITMGLSEKIDWNELGCYVVGIGNDGDEGLALIQRYDPDILITDIIMPGKTGLELAAYLFKNRPRTKVILLTAYEDFNFAKQAIAYGVSQYILKPIDKIKIIEAVAELVDKLSSQDRALREQEQISKIALHAKPILSQSVLFENAVYGMDKAQLSETYSGLWDIDYQSGIISLIQIPQLEKSLYNLASFSIWSYSCDFLEKTGLKSIQKQLKDSIVIIFAYTEEQPIEFVEQIKIILYKLINHIESEKGIVCHGSLSKIYKDISHMHPAYNEAKQAIRNSYFCKSAQVLTGETNVKQQTSPECNTQGFLDSITVGDLDKAKEIYNEVIQNLEKEKNIELAVDLLRDLANGLNRILIQYEELHIEHIDRNLISTEGNFYQQQSDLFEKAKDICSYIKSKQRITGKMILCVERMYADSSFSLNSIANELYLNQSYLSRLFKKEKGITFSQYLVDYRIERAKHLLISTNDRNSDIARKIGFSDERYFSKVFKQRCGMTPREYKMQSTS